jgi:pyruvate formate lyase activating enzyme
MTVTGRIHSVETCGTLDGPGLRFVVFTQGCPLRCLYCHNPDCREVTGGTEITVDELITEVLKYKNYIKNGGVTISGGEPMLQPEFVREVFRKCKENGIHTALDTSGFTTIELVKPVLEFTDLVLLDIKSFIPETYRKVTSKDLEPTLKLARYLHEIHKPTWVRFVLVPDLTDADENIRGLADFVATLDNVERVEVLPFHQMGSYKWEELGYDYALKETPPASPTQVSNTINIFKAKGLPVFAGAAIAT